MWTKIFLLVMVSVFFLGFAPEEPNKKDPWYPEIKNTTLKELLFDLTSPEKTVRDEAIEELASVKIDSEEQMKNFIGHLTRIRHLGIYTWDKDTKKYGFGGCWTAKRWGSRFVPSVGWTWLLIKEDEAKRISYIRYETPIGKDIVEQLSASKKAAETILIQREEIEQSE